MAEVWQTVQHVTRDSSFVAFMQQLLSQDPAARSNACVILEHAFLNTPADPGRTYTSLPTQQAPQPAAAFLPQAYLP